MSSNPEEIVMYNAADLTKYRSQLINKSGKVDSGTFEESQIFLARAAEAKSSKDFIGIFSSFTNGEVINVSFPNSPLTERELTDPPLTTEKLIYNILRNLQPKHACLPSFWTAYHLGMVRHELIEPAYLAKSLVSVNESGRSRLQKALRNNSKKKRDACVRTILRQLGGLPEERGKVSVFMDCRISRAWWRGHLSAQVAQDFKHLEIDAIWEILRNTSVWEQLMGLSVKSLTVICDRNIRSALIVRFLEEPEIFRERAKIKSFLAKIGSRSAYQSLGALSAAQNLEIFREMEYEQ